MPGTQDPDEPEFAPRPDSVLGDREHRMEVAPDPFGVMDGLRPLAPPTEQDGVIL